MTNFEWLAKEKDLKKFLKELHEQKLSLWEFCYVWGIETPSEIFAWDGIETIAEWLAAPHIDKDIFDEEEIHENCTVQILRNSATGEVSVGWWTNEESTGWWENGKRN